MATNVKTGSMSFPFSLGKLMPGASVSIPLTTNFQPVKEDGSTPDTQFNAIFIQAHPDNSGYIYVCNSASAPDTTNYTNVLRVLAKGETFDLTKQWANNRDIGRIFIGAGDADDFAIASIDAV